jgi:hypothetical protein
VANETLGVAKQAKSDEFYTQYEDIEKEMNAYLEYNSDVFKNKTVLLPCDDPEWSNFTKYFAQNFEKIGLKKLISTSYAPNSKTMLMKEQPTLFEVESPQYDESKASNNGKIFTLYRDKSGDHKIDVNDLEWEYLQGNGDFRSEEITSLRDEADIIITNPPFSLFREFLAWIVEANKKFTLIGNKNSITYKEVFPLIRDNKMWLGSTPMSADLLFYVPQAMALEFIANGREGSAWRRVDGVVMGRSTSVWFTNLEHGKRHKPLPLMSQEDNKKFSKHKEIKDLGYLRYDNYDAIEVPYTDAIPSNYEGLMGVPISFLDKYSPEQFEIVGITKTWDDDAGLKTKIYPTQTQVSSDNKRSQVGKLNDGATLVVLEAPSSTYYMVDGSMLIQVYARILIKHKEPKK